MNIKNITEFIRKNHAGVSLLNERLKAFEPINV